MGEQILRAAEMLENVADHDHVKRARQCGQRLFEIMNDGGRISVKTQRVFDAGDREASGCEETRKKAIATAHIEQFGALDLWVKQPEQEHMARIGRLLQCVDARHRRN